MRIRSLVGSLVYSPVRAITADGYSSVDLSRFMLASHTLVPNYRLNTGDPATTPAQRHHVSALSFGHSPWQANNYRFCFQNGYTNNTGSTPAELVPPTAITVRAAVFNGNTKVADITFGGQAEVSINPAQLVWCDPVSVSGLPASSLFIRTYSAIPDGGRRVGRRQTTDNAAGFSTTAIRAESDQATALTYLDSGAITSNSGFPNSYAFGPVCMVADKWDGRSCVLIVGDSIAAGNDNAIGKSWLSDGVYSTVGGKCGYANFAIHSTRPSNQTGDSQYGQKAAIIDSITSINGGKLPMTAIISEHGVNDAGTTNVQSLQDKVQAFLDYIHSKWPAAKLIQTTYTPRVPNDAATIQTDAAIMTATTQTPSNIDRWGVAEWIKTNPSPIQAHIDVREAWTGSSDGVIWYLPPWDTTLAEAANIGATSISVNSAPPSSVIPVLSPGTTGTVETTLIPIGSVTGSGPFTVQLNKALTKAHADGAIVRATPAADGLHPEEGFTSIRAQSAVEAFKVAGGFG